MYGVSLFYFVLSFYLVFLFL
uniref:Uncharacterized protein n=1 Tax=Anguilla anguilla TaxID=7936 RepID=A0A0E9QC13_ANGAN